MPWWSRENFQSAQHPPTSGEQDCKFVGEDNETHDSKELRDMVEADWSQLRQNFSQLHPVAVWEDNRDTDLVIKAIAVGQSPRISADSTVGGNIYGL